MQSVAGILDGYGGWHVVVAPRREMHHHVRPGQLLLVVPGWKLNYEPDARHAANIVPYVEDYIDWWIKTRNDPDDLKHPAVALYQLRKSRGHNRCSVNLYDIVET